LLIVSTGPPANGQLATPASPQPGIRRHYRKSSIDDVVRRLAKSLDLTPVQQSAVKTILEQRMQETLRIRRDSSLSGSERISHFRALQEHTVERIRAVLNEEQRKKYDPLAARKVKPAQSPNVEEWLNKANASK
jgi:hypothetical protein